MVCLWSIWYAAYDSHMWIEKKTHIVCLLVLYPIANAVMKGNIKALF